MLFLSLFVFVCGYYYQQNDVGGYSLGVGGAPVGLNNSVECGLYNPAAFTGTEKLKIFSAYKLTKGEMSPVGSPEIISRLDYAFPDYLGVALPFRKDFFLSISLSVPYRSAIKDSMTFTIVDPSEPNGFRDFPGEYIQSERFYSLNTVIGKTINDRFSVGLNLGVFWKHSSWAAVAEDTAFNDMTTSMDKYGLEPCLGLQYKGSDILSFGFLIKKGFGEAYKYSSTAFDTTFSVESDEGLPLVVGFGTGINLKNKVYFNLSAEYLRWTLAYSDGYWESDDYRNVVRLHLGGQYRLNDLLSMSAGFYTEPSPIKIDPSSDPGSWDQIFLTGGIGLDFGRITLNLSTASSALIKSEPSLREESHFNLSLSYR